MTDDRLREAVDAVRNQHREESGGTGRCCWCSDDWPCSAERLAALAQPAAPPDPEDAECPTCDGSFRHMWPCPAIPRCDEPGCDSEASCRWPSPSGYRRTCGRHMRWGAS